MYPQGFKILPNPKGPFTTGCHDLMIGRSRQGVLMRLFYPTCKNRLSDEPLARWFPGLEYTEGLGRRYFPYMTSFFQSLFNWSTESIRIPSYADAPIANGSFPLIIFSHGLSAHRTLYSVVCNDLASHGFFVAAVEHRDESACSTFTFSDSGEKVWWPQRLVGKDEKEFDLRKQQLETRSVECSKALDALEKLNRGEIRTNDLHSLLDPMSFQDKIDLSRPVLAGHSFGGATTILTLSKDRRFKLGVALDAWMFPLKDRLKELSRDVSQPLLIVLTESFQDQPNFKAFIPFEQPRNRIVTLKGSVHQNQSDTPFLFGSIGSYFAGCWSSLDKDVAINLNNKLMINFICKHLGIKDIGPKVDVSGCHGHLQLGLGLESASFEAAQHILNFTNEENDKNNNYKKDIPTSML